MPSADIAGTSVDADANDQVHGYEDRLALGVPLPRWSNGGGAITFGHIGTHIFDRDSEGLDLHTFALGAVGGQSLGGGYIFGGGATVTYASELDHYSTEAWQLMVNGTIAWKHGDSDGFMAGAVYTSTNTFWIPLIPILGWVHQEAGSPWRFDILLPRGVRIDRMIGDKSSIGGIIDITGGSWIASVANGPLVTARKIGGTLAARYQRQLFGPFRIDARFGMLVQQLELPTEMGTTTLPLRPAAYGQLGIAVGP